jgi:TRAP-type C4-dicarboxylate transport system substrate-binding protein
METKMTDLVKKLRSYPSSTCEDKDIYVAAAALEAQNAQILFWKDRMREALETIKENNVRIAKLEDDSFKYRMALADIQMKAQDILRPIPFQDEDE